MRDVHCSDVPTGELGESGTCGNPLIIVRARQQDAHAVRLTVAPGNRGVSGLHDVLHPRLRVDVQLSERTEAVLAGRGLNAVVHLLRFFGLYTDDLLCPLGGDLGQHRSLS
jgi:hypothetical protein